MRVSLKIRIIVTSVLLGYAAPAFSWGPEGHRIVATIAFSRLDQPIKDQIALILGDEDFVEVSNWADQVRLSRPNTKDWHFVDIPVSVSNYEAGRDCKELVTGDCAVKELERARAVLKDGSQPARARHEALKFIIHFVGDIHQPLHSATNNSRDQGDLGGNNVNTLLLTRTMKLHAVWDHGLIDLDDQDEGDYADTLIAKLVNTGRADSSRTTEDWVNESHALAVSVGYKYAGFRVGVTPTKKIVLGQAYVDKAKPVVDLQLARAGVRLARFLQETLEP
jgi:hypothetical protein